MEDRFTVLAPITKYWEEDVMVEKSPGKTEKSKQRFMEVTVSGLKEDRDEERFSQEAIDDMVMQFKSGTIPFFPDHGRDANGVPNVYSWKSMMGVWVDARQENEKLMATVRLNAAHPDHDMFWGFVKEGMPIGFSIGGKPVEGPTMVEEEIPVIEQDTNPEVKKQEQFNCECIKCNYKMKSTEHCADIKCPKCGGQMRREERPGPGK